jgi:hypothetical protein
MLRWPGRTDKDYVININNELQKKLNTSLQEIPADNNIILTIRQVHAGKNPEIDISTEKRLDPQAIIDIMNSNKFLEPSRQFAEQCRQELMQAGYPFEFQDGAIDLWIGGPDKQHLGGAELEGRLISDVEQGSARRQHVRKLTQMYKIHLMPKSANLVHATKQLVEAIRKDQMLQKVISNIKIKPIPDNIIEQIKSAVEAETNKKRPYSEFWRLPRIVIYIGDGKRQAQFALNKLYRLFKDEKGTGWGPEFNEKVTDYIFFAQGNREDKIYNPEYFEPEDMVYYKSDVNGTWEDFHLINPATIR